MKDYSVLNGMIENQKSELRTAYDKGYNQGVKDFDLILATSKKEEEGYNRGLELAWSCAKRIISMHLSEQEKIFNMQDERAIMDAHSAEEAIDIIKRYDEKQNCIERCCKNCKHSENGMVGNSKRCEVCYYDEVLKANKLFEPMETDNSKIEVGDEIYNDDANVKAVVHRIDSYDRYQCLNEFGAQFILEKGFMMNNWPKTGRHYTQIAEVLEQMRGRSDA